MKHVGPTTIATAALVLAGAASPVGAQEYPNRVVTITIPYAPGGSAEGSLRPVAFLRSLQALPAAVTRWK